MWVCARNAAPYVERCVRSLAAQQDAAFDVLFVDDASSDDTAGLAERALAASLPGRYRVVRRLEQRGKARHAFELLRGATGYTWIAVVDGDDELIDPDALHAIARAYQDGFDVVWTDFETDTGVAGGNGPLDPFDSPRRQGWASSHLFSFRQLLIQRVPDSYFKDESGAWLDCACDMAIAYPVLDQTRRYLFLPRAAYRYTTTNPLSHHAGHGGLSSPRQRERAEWVRSQAPLPCWRPVHEHRPSIDHGLGVKLHQMHVSTAQCFARLDALERQVAQMPFRQLALERLVQREHIPLAWLAQLGGWALDVGMLNHLADTLDGYRQPRVLEFGSGRGSRVLGKLVAARGGTLTSVEHDADWVASTADAIRAHALGDHARVVHCPLVETSCFGHTTRFYDMGFLSLDERFDVVVVDGPPEATGPFARLPALPAIAGHLSLQGFHLYLDDFDREQEQAIARWWLEMAPELKAESLVFDKMVCELTPRV